MKLFLSRVSDQIRPKTNIIKINYLSGEFESSLSGPSPVLIWIVGCMCWFIWIIKCIYIIINVHELLHVCTNFGRITKRIQIRPVNTWTLLSLPSLFFFLFSLWIKNIEHHHYLNSSRQWWLLSKLCNTRPHIDGQTCDTYMF